MFVWIVFQTYAEEGVYDCDTIIGVHDNNVSAIHHCNSLTNAEKYNIDSDGYIKYRIEKFKVFTKGEK